MSFQPAQVKMHLGPPDGLRAFITDDLAGIPMPDGSSRRGRENKKR